MNTNLWNTLSNQLYFRQCQPSDGSSIWRYDCYYCSINVRFRRIFSQHIVKMKQFVEYTNEIKNKIKNKDWIWAGTRFKWNSIFLYLTDLLQPIWGVLLWFEFRLAISETKSILRSQCSSGLKIYDILLMKFLHKRCKALFRHSCLGFWHDVVDNIWCMSVVYEFHIRCEVSGYF